MLQALHDTHMQHVLIKHCSALNPAVQVNIFAHCCASEHVCRDRMSDLFCIQYAVYASASLCPECLRWLQNIVNKLTKGKQGVKWVQHGVIIAETHSSAVCCYTEAERC